MAVGMGFAHNLKNLCGFAPSAPLRVKTHHPPPGMEELEINTLLQQSEGFYSQA